MMKIFLTLILACGLAGILHSQPLKYHRVLIKGDHHLPEKLNLLQITIDHSHREAGGIVTEIDDNEIQILKANKMDYQILISDLSTYYEQRNLHDQLVRSAASGVCNDPNIKVPSHFRLGKMGGFYTLSELENILDTMVIFYPSLIKPKQAIDPIQTTEGRNIWYVKISDNPSLDENEPEVLYTSLHHAREGASLSQLIFYMWYLLENYATDPDIKATLDNTELFFVPCVNPDGYVYNEFTNPNGGGMWRKNRAYNPDNTRGVDLNRNYGYNWGYDNMGSSPTTTSQTYRGTGPFSEPETQAMRNFCNTRQFKNALNAHTFSNVLIYPWGFIPGYYTPDSLTFVNWGELLTRDSRFLYGTCDQTLGYLTNGSSDDWMYGEQSSKPKILSMTPEAGTYIDGFWPAKYRIIDICKTTFTQNYHLAKLAGNFAHLKDEEDKFISSSGFIKYSLQRLGLSSGGFTVSINPLGAGLVNVGAPKFYSSLSLHHIIYDSIPYSLSPGLAAAQQIKYELIVNNGQGLHRDTIVKVHGYPVNVFFDNGNNTNAFSKVGGWNPTTAHFVSPPSSITDSPNGTYTYDDHTSITVATPLNLNNAVYAHLQFYTRFEVEKSFDYSQILVSTDMGMTFNSLCGKYQTSPASNGNADPVYDGRQDRWVKEDIDLSAYLGQNILLRFTLDADFYMEKDGFYFDDLWVRKIPLLTAGLQNVELTNNFKVGPNPANGELFIENPDGSEYTLLLMNNIGQIVHQTLQSSDVHSTLDLSHFPEGMYILELHQSGSVFQKKLVIFH